MALWTQALRQPQTLWIRRAFFQVHLWTAMALVLYIVMLSITGSLLVYRNEINTLLATHKPPFDANATRLTPQQIREAAQRAYPGWTVASVSERITRRSPAYDVAFERGTGGVEKKERYFNPYTGEDLGDTFTRGERYLYWVVELHDNLLLEHDGKFWNAVGSIVVTVTCLTGLVVWWPGVARWKRSLMFRWSSGWRRFNWDVHSAVGFWLFLFLLMWAVTGIYLGIPDPFTRV
ncbi:MAG TPA: PepSY-associated TM helix domain-containing protein, partial [Terriglobia bacterium]|nr:PepSY-associated TM helix domain-containing protein [Terriglobia bacterium]